MFNHDLEQYRALFIEELEEQLQIMDEELLRLEKEGESNEIVQSLFRAAHTIKGSSAAMGLEKIKNLTHEMEQVLDGVRSHNVSTTREMISLLFKCLDSLKEMKENYADGHDDEGSMNIDPLITQLKDLMNPETNNKRQIYQIDVSLAASCEMKMARAIVIFNKLLQWGEVIKTKPSMDEELDDSAYQEMEYVLSTPSTASDEFEKVIGSLLDVKELKVSVIKDSDEENIENSVSLSITNESDSLQYLDSSKSEKGSGSKPKSQTTIRVNVERLEHLMNLVGELVIDQTRIIQVKSNLHRKYNADEDVEELEHVSDHVTRVIADLQGSVMKVRMLPIDQLFTRFPRMVRDLSQSLGKEIELTLEGKETELDRTLIEQIGDPLIHLIRNAIDHGIENPDERIENGKSPKGNICISASHEDNQVAITIKDDGAGIDPNIIKASAIEKGIIFSDEAENLTEQEIIHLIFHPGFSTASQVSEVSGRGVGMDIVRSDIERLNGLIDIQTEVGKGTQFKIRLPLTLAIITGLLVKISDSTFILPMGNVAEIVRISPEEIKMMRGKEVIVNRDRVIPVIWLHDHFHIPKIEKTKKSLSIVIVGTAEKRVALAVDELLGNQDIVIKSLGSFVGKTKFVSGATILGDGRVALILEISDILQQI